MRDSRSSLREYVYIDGRRLDTYFQQMSSPVTYDKVPTWKVSLSLAGPTGEGVQARPARPYTAQEKIAAVLEHLSKHEMLLRGPLDDDERWRDERVFCLDTITATRVLVPPRTQPGEEVPALNLWLSSRTVEQTDGHSGRVARTHTQHLYLIEDLQRDDLQYVDHMSGYSALYILAQELERSHTELFGIPTGGEAKDIARRFSRDPAAFLAAIGARVTPERRVSVFYRLRAAWNDMDAPERGELAIFGYVIAAWEASKDQSDDATQPKQEANGRWWQLWK